MATHKSDVDLSIYIPDLERARAMYKEGMMGEQQVRTERMGMEHCTGDDHPSPRAPDQTPQRDQNLTAKRNPLRSPLLASPLS